MMTRQSRIRLSHEAADYVDQLQEQRDNDSHSKTIDEIILEHKRHNMIEGETDHKTSMMMAEMNRKMEQELNKHFNRLQLGVNNTDRNSQMLLELMNGLMVSSNISDIMPTSEFISKPYNTAKEEVNERIAHQQQRKAEYNKKQNQS